MENQELIDKIKSKYLLENIFKYIPNINFKLSLFFYSKSFQEKCSIKLENYKEKFIERMNGYDISEFLYSKVYKKDYLKKKYEKFLLEKRFKAKQFEKFLYSFLENEKINEQKIIQDKSEIIINIDSPLLEVLSKTKNFEKKYTINISQLDIDKFNLKQDYITYFNKLNQSNIKFYSLLYQIDDLNKMNYLGELNIDFKKIKKLTIESRGDKNNCFSNIKQIKKFLGFFSMSNNLIYLNINLDFGNFKEDYGFFEKINNCKLLNYLYVKNLHYNKQFSIKLKYLKILSLRNCYDLQIENIFCDILEILDFSNSRRITFKCKNNQCINLNKLKELDLSYSHFDLKQLKYLNCNNLEVLKLESNQITNIKITEERGFDKREDMMDIKQGLSNKLEF